MSEQQPCQWFLLCEQPAAGVTPHSVLGWVPICERCADRFDLEIEPLVTWFCEECRSPWEPRPSHPNQCGTCGNGTRVRPT